MPVRLTLFLLLCICSISSLSGQMIQGKNTLVGDEWIRYGQRYYKFSIEADGVYRIPYSTLESSGISATAVGTHFRLFSMGIQVPIFVSTEGVFDANDFIEFYGYKNRGEMDRHIFLHPDEDMLNPYHSMFTDQRVYYLSVEDDGSPSHRVTVLANQLSNPPVPETYYLHKEVINFNSTFNDPYFPLAEGGAVSYSSCLHAEGFAKTSETSSITQINTSNRATEGPDALLRIRLASTNYSDHRMVMTWNDLVIDTLFKNGESDLRILDTNYSIPLALLNDINQLNLTALAPLNRHALVNIELSYLRSPVENAASESKLFLSPKPVAQYLVIDGFQHNGLQPILYSLDGQSRMIADINGSNRVHFVWPAIQSETGLHMIDPAVSIRSVNALEQKVFTDISGDDTEFIVITHPDLMTIGTESEYILYRSSPAGGAYRAKAYSILDLYDQFGYGIVKHPQAIRNFVEYFHRHWPSAKMVFIVGRGIEYHRSRYPGGWEYGFFVPTFGRPGSDNLLMATTGNLLPRYPVGRLAIFDSQGVSTYLSKVKEHDLARFLGQTIADKAWIKNVMHISGGKTVLEQIGFKSSLQSLGDELAASDYAAKVSFFQKQSTDIIGESQSAQILKLLHEGCGIINYLGHSASTTFEFNINDPSEWNNKGRYPVFSAMGCSAGQIHGTLLSLSDNYVQIPNEGAIAFLSGSGSQFPPPLVSWCRAWYNYFGNLDYGSTLGESNLFGLKAISNFVNPQIITSNPYRYLLEQHTFQGDPAIQLHPLPGPDYVIDRSHVSISPEVLNTKLDSFDLKFSIANIGRNLRQIVAYTIKIRLPDGQEILIGQGQDTAGTYETIITTRLPLMTGGKSGAFRLLISLDPGNLLEELPAPQAEANNNLIDNLNIEGIVFVVIDNLISAVYPPDFSIVTISNPELIATGSIVFGKEQDVVFELDTTSLFNSPLRIREEFYSQSSVLKWSPQVTMTPDQVYYWRVSTDSISPEQGYLWSRHSFVYLPESSEGWNQSHFYQLTDDPSVQIVPDSLNHTFQFDRKVKNYRMLNRYHDVPLGLVPYFFEDGKFIAKLAQRFRDRKVHGFVVAIDSITGKYIINPVEGLYGSVPDVIPMEGFAYDLTTAASRQNMINFIENVIPPGYFVFFYTYQHTGFPEYHPEDWAADEAEFGKSIFSVIEQQYEGSGIRSLANIGSVPYIVLFQKDRGGIEEQIATNVDDVISISFDGGSFLKEGTYVSVPVGPASKWGSIQHDITSFNDTSGLVRLSAWAFSQDHSDTLLISDNITEQTIDISGINAEEYPFIQLALYTSDSITFKPAAIGYWLVLFEGYPECLINTGLGFEFIADTLLQGETMMLRTFIENISSVDVDTLPVSLRIINDINQTVELRTTIQPLLKHSNAEVQFQQSTQFMKGDYKLVLEINPDRTIREFNYNNNIGILPMHVFSDDANPVLDVTFDGVHIQDGDLVAAKPLILIQLHDENESLRIDDTTAFNIFIQYPSETKLRRISFLEEWVKFTGAPSTGKNIATVMLTPDLYEDGIYLFQVKAKDASGNDSGDNDYLVSFEVINGESVSYIYNFPNPFSSGTRFVYTLTGQGSPAYYNIQIISITGIIVKEITQDELGPLVVGTHMTEFVWDGSDNNGNPLAAGIYLFRMTVRDENQKEYDNYPVTGDIRYFNNGWGKLVIVR